MIGVLIADDQEMVRSGLRMVVDRHDDLRVVALAADGEQAVAAAFAHRPDVIVMDVRMPRATGVEATERILRDWPHPEPRPRVIVLTTFDLDEYVHSALRAGASGFLLKNTSPDYLADAIRTVVRGEAMLAPSVTQRLIRTFVAAPPPTVDSPLDVLTQRETDVLLLVAQGMSNAEIGAELGLSAPTVKSRINRIFTRLGVSNRVQAALLAHNAGLLDQLP
ncbi:response regulator [Actinomadura rudentiformis]|uniref:Response regulator transcription factor n=1 Tax=Actinomadura rudentiformis TaxID=359158 RepID=A0A6H9Z4T3_9ACTN|nr:response regulator transcription factor [Actinomadura rudentiformis]KAB2349992.1 response regulator transcription factor [Actinomadura rudentiformis]